MDKRKIKTNRRSIRTTKNKKSYYTQCKDKFVKQRYSILQASIALTICTFGAIVGAKIANFKFARGLDK